MSNEPVITTSERTLVVKSQVKTYLNEKEYRFSPDSTDALSALLGTMLDAAIARAKGDGRKTVKAEDYQYLQTVWNTTK